MSGECLCGGTLIVPAPEGFVCAQCGRIRVFPGDPFQHRWDQTTQKFERWVPGTVAELYAEFDRADAPKERV